MVALVRNSCIVRDVHPVGGIVLFVRTRVAK